MTALNIRFMANQFLSRSMTFSSQQTAFPAANLFNDSRSKAWKPAGNFEVTSLNNRIYVNDGADKTVTLTQGSYLPATLAAHIQTQLNITSSNWLVTYDAALTFKFTMSRTSGTGILKKTVTLNAAWDMLGYTGATDLTPGPFVADEQRNHTSEWIQCDLGVPQQATFLALIGAIDDIFPLSETATVKLRANNLDYWVNPPVDVAIPVTALGLFSFFESIGSYRFMRLEIVDRLNPLGPTGIKLSNAYVGDHVTVSLTNMAVGFGKELVDPSIGQQSESGALFFQTRPRYLNLTEAVIQLVNGDEQRALEQLFYDLGIRTPFFVSIDPGLEITTSLEELTRFMIMSRNPKLTHVLRNYYNIDWDMREAF